MKKHYSPLFLPSLRPLINAAEGNVIISVALSAFLLLTCIGAAIDMARAQILQSRMSIALDSAALAALRNTSTTSGTAQKVQAAALEANRFFKANFPLGYLAASQPAIANVTFSNNDNTLAMTATAIQATQFLSIVGISTVRVGASSQVTKHTAGRVEVVMVLDNTGSMSDSLGGGVTKMEALKQAATKFLDIVYPGSSASSTSNLFIGIVPFGQTVNIGRTHDAWVDPSFKTEFGPYGQYDWRSGPGQPNDPANWMGCVKARYLNNAEANGYNYNDAVPSTSDSSTLFLAYNYGSDGDSTFGYNYWADYTTTPTTYITPQGNALRGPNFTCPEAITPLTNDKTVLTNAINDMQPLGDTNIDQGIAWGWRLISPKWRGLWGGTMNGNNLPEDYAPTTKKKIVILMTDGKNTYSYRNYTAYDVINYGYLYGYTFSDYAAQGLDIVTEKACYEMSQNNIFIYTIGFGTNNTGSDTDINPALLQYCANGVSSTNAASAGRYFYAPTNQDLTNAFTSIADSLTLLRVSK